MFIDKRADCEIYIICFKSIRYSNYLRKLLRSGATDEELKEAMRQAIWKKPACHNFSDERRDEEVGQKKEHRAMYGIGG